MNPMDTGARRVAFFGTAVGQMNGYSKCVYALLKRLEDWRADPVSGDLEVYHFAFQDFYKNTGHDRILTRTKVYDAFHYEDPKQQGFGFSKIREFYACTLPHVCIIYNDMLVVTGVIEQLVAAAKDTGHSSKIVVYIDQVYGCQKLHFIEVLNRYADAVVAFTPTWERCIRSQGLRADMPTHVLVHGFDPLRNYPVPRDLARQYIGMSPDDFVILNLNRNQPRKRWDICVMAAAEFISKHLGEPIKLIVGTSATEGAWNITELFIMEFRKRGIDPQQGMMHVMNIDRPQQLSDEDINVLYNASDVGINTCDGEGLGLCNFEHAALGVPQIVPRLGGFVDVFQDEYALMVDPKLQYYVDSSRDGVGGLADLCHFADFAAALEKYYADPSLRAEHGRLGRQRILRDFMWDDIARDFEKIVDKYAVRAPPAVPDAPAAKEAPAAPEAPVAPAVPAALARAPAVRVPKQARKGGKKNKKKGKHLASEIADLQRRLDRLVAINEHAVA
jgi:glycosyltransferase involved in cell wall biosynthesis